MSEHLMDEGQTEPTKSIFGKEFTVSTVETMHCTYTVLAADEKQAAARLRVYLKDQQLLMPDIVKPKGEPERVRWLLRKKK